MAFLVVCSFEVSGLPIRFARALNSCGEKTYYVSLQPAADSGHDSTAFHEPAQPEAWDLSARFAGLLADDRAVAAEFAKLRREYGITAALALGQQAFLLAEAGISYIYYSYGADVDIDTTLPVCRLYRPFGSSLAAARYNLARKNNTLKSLRAAKLLRVMPYQVPLLKYLRLNQPLVFIPHIMTVDPLARAARECGAAAEDGRKLAGSERYFFSSARQYWVARPPQPVCLCDRLIMPLRRRALDLTYAAEQYKGIDVMLRMFARYLETDGGGDGARLVLVRKGPDTTETDRLARELGVAGSLVWVDEMPRGKLAALYAGAACCFGQLNLPCLTMSSLEPLLFGTPCISRFDCAGAAAPMYDAEPPIMNTADVDRGAEFMRRMADSPVDRAAAGAAGREWILANCNEQAFTAQMRNVFASLGA